MSDPTLPKPPHGVDCNGCGRCCVDELCPLAAALFSQDGQEIAPVRVVGRCPAIEDGDGGKLVCGLVRNPRLYFPFRAAAVGDDRLREAALILIGSGKGCDAQLETEPANELYREWLSEWADRNERKIARAKEKWGFGHVSLGTFLRGR